MAARAPLRLRSSGIRGEQPSDQIVLMLVGRAKELGAVQTAVQDARNGASTVLVVRGEPGIGKTDLLKRAVHAGRDLTVLEVQGVESEMELGYAALHRFLAPLIGNLDRLPVPQRKAVHTAFGVIDGPPPDRFLV